MFNEIKQRGVVGKDGKIEIQASELPEGTIVEVIILVEHNALEESEHSDQPQDTTDYLLSSAANRQHLLASLQQLETQQNLVSFTPEEWHEEHNIHS